MNEVTKLCLLGQKHAGARQRFGGRQEMELVVPAPKTAERGPPSPGPLFEATEKREAAN